MIVKLAQLPCVCQKVIGKTARTDLYRNRRDMIEGFIDVAVFNNVVKHFPDLLKCIAFVPSILADGT